MLKYFKSQRPSGGYELLSKFGLLGRKFTDLALSDFKKALKNYEQIHKGKIHPNIADTYHDIGNIYKDQKENKTCSWGC